MKKFVAKNAVATDRKLVSGFEYKSRDAMLKHIENLSLSLSEKRPCWRISAKTASFTSQAEKFSLNRRGSRKFFRGGPWSHIYKFFWQVFGFMPFSCNSVVNVFLLAVSLISYSRNTFLGNNALIFCYTIEIIKANKFDKLCEQLK